jgi:tetratricopeptide (TPR) repeat protein
MLRCDMLEKEDGNTEEVQAPLKISYPKKYWWVLLIALPITLAVIKEAPDLAKLFRASAEPAMQKGTINIGSMVFINSMSVIESQYEKAHGQPLKDEDVKQKFERASTLAEEGSYKDAIALLEEIAPKADVPAIFNNLGSLHAQLGDVAQARMDFGKAAEKDAKDEISKINVQALDELPLNLLAKENGGQVLLAPNDDWLKTIDGNEESSGLIFHSGQSAVYAFKDERPATFDAFAVLIPQSGNNVKEFELLAGNESPTGEFRSIGKFTVVNAKFMKSPYQEFKFPPVTAKYFKVLLLSSYHFNDWIELYEFRLSGRLQK